MKKYILLSLIFCMTQLAFGQRFGYIDSEVILNQMPEYQAAQKELNKLTAQWQKELKAKEQLVVRMRQQLQAEKVLLTDDLLAERENNIQIKEKELQSFKSSVFGYNGKLFEKRQELIKPVQGKLFAAVRRVCKKKKLHFMFDKASDLHMIYTDPTYHFTDMVLEELGIKEEGK